MLNQNTQTKINNITLQYNLNQVIKEATHFTETSQSLIDLFLVSPSCDVVFSGVGEPILDQNIRFHCPIFCFLNCSRSKPKCFKRSVWKYQNGDYEGLRRDASLTDWNQLFNNNIDIYTKILRIKLFN